MADPKFLENLNIPGIGALVVSDATAVKGAGISAATSVQNNDTTVPTGKAVTTELNKKQNTLAAGTGLAFGTGADANKLGHSNSVTAKTSSSVKKFTYDANGHVTDSSELSTAESNALASGIDSAKVAQIETNKNNISIVDITSNVTAESGYTVDTTSHLYRQGRHVFGTLVIKKASGNFSSASQETVATIGTYAPEYQYLGISAFTNTIWAVQNIGYVFVQNSGASGAGGITVMDTATTNNCVKIPIDYVTA